MSFRRILSGRADDETRTRDLSITNRLHYHCATSAMGMKPCHRAFALPMRFLAIGGLRLRGGSESEILALLREILCIPFPHQSAPTSTRFSRTSHVPLLTAGNSFLTRWQRTSACGGGFERPRSSISGRTTGGGFLRRQSSILERCRTPSNR